MRARAMVQVADRQLELVDREVPAIGHDAALLKVEACGLCGSDVEQYRGRFSQKGLVRYPLIPGHEPVGRIVEIGSAAARAWAVKAGDRVAVEPHISCGRCRTCTGGSYHLCKSLLPVAAPAYGYLPLDFEHGLWGGYAQYLYLHPRTILHKLPEELPLDWLLNKICGGSSPSRIIAGSSVSEGAVMSSGSMRNLPVCSMMENL